MSPPSPWRARITAVAGGGAALAATLIVLWLVGQADPPPGLPGGGSALPLAATAPSASGVPQPTTRLPEDPPTAADPFLTPDLRYQIEAMLLDAGDATTPEELKRRLSQLVHKHFAADLATRALALAERYVDYRVALGTLKAPRPDDPTALRNSLNARERLRERYFAPEEHEALFERESALDRYTLARLEIQHNTGLTKEEKARALKDTEAELPPEQRADRAHAMAHLGAAAQTQDFEARSVDERTRYQLRSATYGTNAAQALARLDQEERAWNQKLDDYAAAKAQAHDPSQMQALRERLFTPQEQLRLEAALALRQSQR